MIGLILLLVSWGLLRWEDKGLDALGLDQPRLRLRQFAAGLAATGLAATVQQLGHAWATGDAWQLNSRFTVGVGFLQLRGIINSVLYEELLFRGYLLYQAIRFLGARHGVWLSAAAFGIYHWFSYGVLGQPVAMIYVFLMTGAFGGMCAFAFAETKSLAAPVGLHLGWNLVCYLLFSAGPVGPGILLPVSGTLRMKTTGLPAFLLGPGLTVALTGLVVLFLIWQRKPLPPAKI